MILTQIKRHCNNLYGFAADPNKTLCQNIHQRLQQLNLDDILRQPSHLKYHQLSSDTSLPPCTHLLLDLGAKFFLKQLCLTPNLKKIFGQISRDVRLRAYARDQEWDNKPDASNDKKNMIPKYTLNPSSTLPLLIYTRNRALRNSN